MSTRVELLRAMATGQINWQQYHNALLNYYPDKNIWRMR